MSSDNARPRVGLLMSPLTNNDVVLGLKGVDIAIIICVVVRGCFERLLPSEKAYGD